MVRQYIGARYVPKFYQNSLNPLSNEWEENVTYEALTVVTYLNDSYTSKKPVPVTVGNPRNNPEYWSLTGAYNGQVEQYRQEVLNLETEIDNFELAVQEDINEVNERIDDLNVPKRVIVCTDSYGLETGNVTPFVEKLQTKLDLSNSNFYVAAANGGGYKRAASGLMNIKDTLQNMENTITDHDTITNVICTLGFNDIFADSLADLPTYYDNFINYVKTTYPNAKISMGCFTYLKNYSTWLQFIAYNKVLAIQKQACLRHKIEYIKNAEFVFHNWLLVHPTTYHPNNDGSEYLANCCYNVLNGNGIDVHFQNMGKITDGTHTINTIEYIDNGKASITFEPWTQSVVSDWSGTVIGELQDSMFCNIGSRSAELEIHAVTDRCYPIRAFLKTNTNNVAVITATELARGVTSFTHDFNTLNV